MTNGYLDLYVVLGGILLTAIYILFTNKHSKHDKSLEIMPKMLEL